MIEEPDMPGGRPGDASGFLIQSGLHTTSTADFLKLKRWASIYFLPIFIIIKV